MAAIGPNAILLVFLVAGVSGFVVPPQPSAARITAELHVSSTKFTPEVLPAIKNIAYGEESRQYRRTVYTHDDWRKHRRSDRFIYYLRAIFSSGVYKSLAREVTATTAIATLVCLYNALVGGYTDLSGVQHTPVLTESWLTVAGLPLTPFSLCTSSLGLLLVFRTNTSYQRWDEARKNWGMNINHTRDLVRMGNAYYDNTGVSPEKRAADLNMLALCTWAFVRSMKRHLSPQGEDETEFRVELYEKLPFEQARGIIEAAHRPNRALQDLSVAIENLPMHFLRKDEIHQALTIFEDDLGSSERLLTSPVPLFYSRHTARFLSAWLFLLPFALYEPCSGSWNHVSMIPATTVVSIFLFGIDEIATQLEEPFTILPMQAFCDKIYNWCMEIVSWQPGDNGMVIHSPLPEHVTTDFLTASKPPEAALASMSAFVETTATEVGVSEETAKALEATSMMAEAEFEMSTPNGEVARNDADTFADEMVNTVEEVATVSETESSLINDITENDVVESMEDTSDAVHDEAVDTAKEAATVAETEANTMDELVQQVMTDTGNVLDEIVDTAKEAVAVTETEVSTANDIVEEVGQELASQAGGFGEGAVDTVKEALAVAKSKVSTSEETMAETKVAKEAVKVGLRIKSSKTESNQLDESVPEQDTTREQEKPEAFKPEAEGVMARRKEIADRVAERRRMLKELQETGRLARNTESKTQTNTKDVTPPAEAVVTETKTSKTSDTSKGESLPIAEEASPETKDITESASEVASPTTKEPPVIESILEDASPDTNETPVTETATEETTPVAKETAKVAKPKFLSQLKTSTYQPNSTKVATTTTDKNVTPGEKGRGRRFVKPDGIGGLDRKPIDY